MFGMLRDVHGKIATACENGFELGRGRAPVMVVLPAENQNMDWWLGA